MLRVHSKEIEIEAQIVTAVYRPHPGKEDTLAALIEKHYPLLRAEGLATERAPVVMRSQTDGTFIEVFEWINGGAAGVAHENPAVSALWEAMAEVADFLTLADLPEAATRFPHFRPV